MSIKTIYIVITQTLTNQECILHKQILTKLILIN